MLQIPFYWLDVFTSEPFGGGPTVVCLVDKNIDDNVLSNIAKETGVLETAFVEEIGEREYNLRWFYSDGSEATFAGYATLAATHTLVEEYGVKSPITFHTLTEDWIGEVNNGKVTVFIPMRGDLISTDDERILEALNIKDYVEILFGEGFGNRVYCIVLETQDQVKDLEPDQCLIGKVLSELEALAVIFTARAEEPYDFVYRLFVSSREDYACGSGQGVLAPYWQAKLGKSKVKSKQPHERVSTLEAEALENGVNITSTARILIKGTLLT